MQDDEELLLPWLESKREPKKPEKRTTFARNDYMVAYTL